MSYNVCTLFSIKYKNSHHLRQQVVAIEICIV
nr:MAG TPA: hypothetical protein [Caudoviricetes sp.]